MQRIETLSVLVKVGMAFGMIPVQMLREIGVGKNIPIHSGFPDFENAAKIALRHDYYFMGLLVLVPVEHLLRPFPTLKFCSMILK